MSELSDRVDEAKKVIESLPDWFRNTMLWCGGEKSEYRKEEKEQGK